MAQSLKQIKNRIRSIENTRKVTSAMQMISATKLSRIDTILSQTRPFARKLDGLFASLTQGRDIVSNPDFSERPQKQRIVLCVITSDNGLCGAYNANILRLAEEFIKRYDMDKVKLVIVGKKGYNYFKKDKARILHTYIGLNGRYSDKVSQEITQTLSNLFTCARADEIYVAYTYFKNALNSRQQLEKFLNLESPPGEKKDYLLEPNISRILDEFIPVYLSTKMRLILLEAFTSEHAARLVAMKTATENAKELLHQLVLLRNKVRQANITREIIEIISSAEALKG